MARTIAKKNSSGIMLVQGSISTFENIRTCSLLLKSFTEKGICLYLRKFQSTCTLLKCRRFPKI